MDLIYCSACHRPEKSELDFCTHCGSALIELKEEGLLPPYTILRERFKITDLLKTGGMGRVYKAEDGNLSSICAVKELVLDGFQDEEKNYIISQFKAEAEMLAKLRHKNLPYVIDYFSTNGKYYIVMDHIEGKDLETILNEAGTDGLDIEKILDWAIQICYVLEYLHSQEHPVVFRDLKPSNIMVRDSENQIMLVDFGLAARVMDKEHGHEKTSAGTEGYAPPEQYEGKHDPRSDIYSLGATLHHLITGISPMVPFKFQTLKKLKPELPSKLDSIIMKSVEHDINRRYQTINHLKKDLIKVEENIKTTKSSLVNKIKDSTSKLSKKFIDSIGLSSDTDEEEHKEKINVFLVDDEDGIRSLFKNLIELNKDMELTGIAVNGLDALRKLYHAENFPDVILMDIMMPEMDGIETTKEILKIYPRARIVMLTVLCNKTSVIESFKAGAKGYMIKYKVDEVIDAIRASAKGETPIESSVAGFLLQELGK
ncbi:MAG: protein kinase [Candidatus Eremiobacterota bacterium]